MISDSMLNLLPGEITNFNQNHCCQLLNGGDGKTAGKSRRTQVSYTNFTSLPSGAGLHQTLKLSPNSNAAQHLTIFGGPGSGATSLPNRQDNPAGSLRSFQR
jgi:hypothetical protein